eukprot:12518759-Heterocapsa_arctica.AAC.1
MLHHVLPGGFPCTGTGWPSSLHRLEYGIYSQIVEQQLGQRARPALRQAAKHHGVGGSGGSEN